MGSSSRTISQQAFDSLLAENISDLGMDPDEALDDAVQTLTLQGVDLSGIVKCVPGVNRVEDNPVMRSLDGLKKVAARLGCSEMEGSDLDEVLGFCDEIYGLCSSGGENVLILTKNGGVELLVSICRACRDGSDRVLVPGLRALSSVLRDFESRETFWRADGPKIIMDILKSSQNPNLLDCGFSIVVAAATGNEIVKEAFVELKIEELFIEILRGQPKGVVPNLFDAIRALLTPDDNRVAASQVYGYARRFAKIGIADALVDAFHEGIGSSSLVSACIALKAIAVNDEICRAISLKGGIDVILQCIDDSGEHNNKAVAKSCCSLLSKLAGSDANKNAIVQKGGLDRLIKLSSKFYDDPSVLQEVMSIISVLSLRSPENASRAVEAGAGDLAIQVMQKFPAAYQMQRQSCHMIRNLVARNPENRTILLSNGVEKIIRRAKASHESCKEAATDALRDLGLDNYNA